jgi:diguanylate cyclase (GGDEF)-like protein
MRGAFHRPRPLQAINDSLGHPAGDALLVEVAGRLRVIVRRSDVVVRFGGDEFTVILNDVSHRDQVARVARQVLSALGQVTIWAGSKLRRPQV